jgi:hypothetical protein
VSATSRIPAALDALRAAAVAALPTVTVVDGPPLDWDTVQVAVNAVSDRQFLFVGALVGVDVAVVGEQEFNAAGAVSRDERFTINCTAWCNAGESDVKARRDEAFAVVAAVEQFIRTDPSLGGAVLYARVAEVGRVGLRQTEQGADATVEFTVACRAYLD